MAYKIQNFMVLRFVRSDIIIFLQSSDDTNF